MGIRNREQFIADVRKRKPRVYVNGQQVESIVDHPAFQVGLNCAAVTFEQATHPQTRELATVWSTLINEDVSRWTHLLRNAEDAMAKIRLHHDLANWLCPCHYRCVTSDVLHAAWAVSHEIDKSRGTKYHPNVVEIVKEAQRNDWIIGGGFNSPKGDRSKGPTEQEDPDMYLRVVEKRRDGIVVRGAKAQGTAAPYTDLLCIVELQLAPEYYVGFFTPVDAKGITHICRAPHAPESPPVMDNPLSSRLGGHVVAMIVFEDVFVPWERVFMCGECDSLATFASVLASSHLWHKCMCRWINMDLSIGATALIADYNGVASAPHIRNYLAEMAMDAEIVDACSVAAAAQGTRHDSSIYYPKMTTAATGKVYSSRKLGENRYYMQDTAGGLVATMASEQDFQSPETSKFLWKYYKGKQGVPTEDRVRAFKLIEDLTASEFAGWYHAMCISGGGAAQSLKDMIAGMYDVEQSKNRAKRAAKIER